MFVGIDGLLTIYVMFRMEDFFQRKFPALYKSKAKESYMNRVMEIINSICEGICRFKTVNKIEVPKSNCDKRVVYVSKRHGVMIATCNVRGILGVS